MQLLHKSFVYFIYSSVQTIPPVETRYVLHYRSQLIPSECEFEPEKRARSVSAVETTRWLTSYIIIW